MSAHPLRLASTVARDVRWDWLAPAVGMAAAGHGVHPLAADRAALEWTCFPRVATRTTNGTAQSVGAARDFGLATLRRWTVAGRTDDIAIVLSELLTNALRHGANYPARPVRVALVQPAQFVLVVVSDPGRQVPVLREPDYLAESGRGLHVINALSDAWGCTAPTDEGKAVWALFAVRFTGPRPALQLAPGWLLSRQHGTVAATEDL
jgi:anti-sigma regulatory factor (Ser/Thr protein kinase)